MKMRISRRWVRKNFFMLDSYCNTHGRFSLRSSLSPGRLKSTDMNVRIDTSPLKNQNAIRGIGRYTSELVRALRSLQTSHTFFTSDQESKDVDIIHYPFFDLFFATLPLINKAKTIVTIHDMTPLVFPTHYPRGIRGQLKFFD